MIQKSVQKGFTQHLFSEKRTTKDEQCDSGGVPIKKGAGFTLIELLIVIGILAILATTVVVVLNPGELLAQARDSQRIGDLSSVQSAVAFYLSAASNAAITTATKCTVAPAVGNYPGAFSTCTVTNSSAVDGTGWVGINFTSDANVASPISKLPIDPTNTATYPYMFNGSATSTIYKLYARLESKKYRPQMAIDGGTQNSCTNYTEAGCWYEVGNSLGNL